MPTVDGAFYVYQQDGVKRAQKRNRTVYELFVPNDLANKKISNFGHKRMPCSPFVILDLFALLTCQQKAPTFLNKRTMCDPFIKRTLFRERPSVIFAKF